MKELEKIRQLTSQEIHAINEETKQEIITSFNDPTKRHLPIWEIDIVKFTIVRAEFKQVAVSFTAAQKGNLALKKEIIQKPNCVYFQALNKKNADKQLLSRLKKMPE